MIYRLNSSVLVKFLPLLVELVFPRLNLGTCFLDLSRVSLKGEAKGKRDLDLVHRLAAVCP